MVRPRLAAGRALYAALNWAGATEAAPFAATKARRDPVPAWEKRAPYTPEEVAALLARAEGADRLMVLLGAHAGLRVSEALALTQADLQSDRRHLRVRLGKGG